MRDSPGGDDDGAHSDEGFLIEFVALGNAVKVSAIDPATGTEVSILGAATASRHDLMALAAKKLRYVLAKGGDGDSPSPARGRVDKKGIVA